MNPIAYVSLLRKYLMGTGLISFVGIVLLILLVDPTINNLYIVGFLICVMAFLTSFLSLGGLWWFFDERNRLLPLTHINQILYQSLFSSSIVVLMLVLSQTNQLNIITTTLVLFVYLLYQFWINSKS